MVITNNNYNYSGILLSDISLHPHGTTCEAAGWCKDDELEWECGHCDIVSGDHPLPHWTQDCVTTEADPVTQTLIVSLITWARGTKTPYVSNVRAMVKNIRDLVRLLWIVHNSKSENCSLWNMSGNAFGPWLSTVIETSKRRVLNEHCSFVQWTILHFERASVMPAEDQGALQT